MAGAVATVVSRWCIQVATTPTPAPVRPANSTAQGIISAGHGIGRVAWVQRYSTPSMPSVITPPATAPYARVGRARRARTAATSAPPSRLGGHVG